MDEILESNKISIHSLPTVCSILTLPSVVRCKILSYLDWEDRIVTAKSIPGWEADLETSYTWQWVEFTNWIIGLPEHYDVVRAEKDQRHCIQKYGKFFQNCTIALSVFDVQENSHGVKLINQITRYCTSLKTLKVYHEFMFCTFEGKWEDYLVPLRTLCTKCKHLRYIQLCSLDDCPENRDTHNCKFFEVIEELDLCKWVETIEFTLRDNCPRPVNSLVNLRNLRVLKTQLSTISTPIIQELVKQNLEHLYLHKDHGISHWSDQIKKHPVLWHEIKASTNSFSVHYLFEDVCVEESDFTLNPFLKSITFSRMPKPLSRDILRSIAALYSKSLTSFAHLSMMHVTLQPYDDMESLPCDYYYFASQCALLDTFMTGIPLPCEAIWCLSMKGKKLKRLHAQASQLLYNYNVCLPVPSTLIDGDLGCEASFCKEVSRWLGIQWKPLTEEQMCEKSVHLLQL